MYQRGYRLDAIDEKQKPKVTQMKMSLSNLLVIRLRILKVD